MLSKKVEQYLQEIKSFEASDSTQLEEFRIKYLGRKGVLKNLFAELKTAAPEQRKDFGQTINILKRKVEEKINRIQGSFENDNAENLSDMDLSKPAEPFALGSRHPVSVVRKEMVEIFERIGFTVSEGPDIENDWYNFTALNIPEDHPAKDMQDTFYIANSPETLLRTHTSPQQIRVMEHSQPPIRIICPGRVYRNETISARAHCIFHQVEGLYIDDNVSFTDLKQTLYYFVQEMYGKDTKVRFRPSYFPFTEPSAEMDISCVICKGKGCPVCKHSGWVEILGCGMVDPAVLENCNIDGKKYTGFAFGLGIERPAMLKYGINDIRLFFENDIRFLKQFTSAI